MPDRITPKLALDYFIGAGYPTNSAAGIVGNIYGESNFNHLAIGDGGKAFGLAQWHPDRQANFASVFGIPIQQSTPMQQLQFINWELNNTEKRAGAVMKAGGSVEDMTNAFMKLYERPANSSSLGKRISGAKGVLSGALDAGKGLLSKSLGGLGNVIPGVGAVANIIGLGGKSWIDQIRDWLSESYFWQRFALGFLGLLLILGAIYLLGNKILQQAK